MMAPQDSPRRRRSPTKKEKQGIKSRRGEAPAEEAVTAAQVGVESEPRPQRAGARPPEPAGLALGPSVLDVRLLREGRPEVAALSVGLDENFGVQVRFLLRGADAKDLVAEESSFEVRVYAEEVTSGARSDVASQTANLAKGSLEYEVEMQASALPSGLYRLITVVSLEAPVRAIGYHQGPVVNVTAAESTLRSGEPLGVPLSRSTL